MVTVSDWPPLGRSWAKPTGTQTSPSHVWTAHSTSLPVTTMRSVSSPHPHGNSGGGSDGGGGCS